MKKLATLLIAAAAAFSFSSCATQTHAQHKGGIGAGIGAAAGAIVGHQSGKAGEGAAIGGVLGGLIGHAVGSNQDKKEGNYPEPKTDPWGRPVHR